MAPRAAAGHVRTVRFACDVGIAFAAVYRGAAGVSEVVFVTADHPAWHRRYLAVLDRDIAAAAAGDPQIASVIVNSFAASPRDAREARAYLEEVRAEYLRQYEKATRA